jgi:hypothetical protein
MVRCSIEEFPLEAKGLLNRTVCQLSVGGTVPGRGGTAAGRSP